MLIVAANGPAGSGKSFNLKRLGEALSTGTKANVHHRSLKTPLRSALFDFIQRYVDQSMRDTDENYAIAKNMDIGGITGRQFMIGMGDGCRLSNQEFLPNVLLGQLERYGYSQSKIPQIVLIDDLGFPPELTRLRRAHTVIVPYYEQYAIDNAGSPVYAHGQQFENDSRVCLRGDADLVDPDMDTLYHLVCDKLSELYSAA